MKFLDSAFKREGANQDHEAVLDSLSTALTEAGDTGDQVKEELSVLTASGNGLDEWGSWFGISRLSGETDDDMRNRILRVMGDKATIPALIQAVKIILGDDTIVTPYEPFEDVRYFNRSTFSGTGRFPDEGYYRIGVIEFQISKPSTPQLEAYMKTVKAAGVNVILTYVG